MQAMERTKNEQLKNFTAINVKKKTTKKSQNKP
jgi:hypothetical protein